MARPFHVEIQESAEYLEKSLHKARTVGQKEKLQMLWWLKSGQVKQHQEVAQRLGRNPSTITRWLQHYRQGGMQELLSLKKSPGRPREIDEQMLPQLQARLAQPEGFKSYGEIEQWVQSELGKAVKYKTVHKTVRYDLKAKLKVPRPKSIKQDPEAVKLFKKTSPSPS
jgi:transposase